MNRESKQSDDNERHEPEGLLPSSLPPGTGNSVPSGPKSKPNTAHEQFIAKLKQGLEKTRLPADERERILAELPPPDERERLLREMQEKGGMSFDQFMQSLGFEAHLSFDPSQ